MSEYLKKNKEYWDNGYAAENVESFVFRPYGRIFKYELGLTGGKNEKLLDFGCGQGAALKFFKSKGFDVYGVDISDPDIAKCQEIMPDVADHFSVIPAKPLADNVFFGGDYDAIVSIQTLYYYSNEDLQIRLKSLYDQMKPGAVLYATMMGTGHYMYKHAEKHVDGLYRVEFQLPRLSVSNYYLNFTHSEEELLEKFRIFEKLHVGFYDAKYREDEGGSFHYTYVGRKPL